MRGSTWFWLLAAPICGIPQRAQAHDPPTIRHILRNGDDGAMTLETNRGLIFRASGQDAPWRLMCNEALDISVSEVPSMAYVADGRLLVATSVGLKSTADDGCSWDSASEFDQLLVTALAVHPAKTSRVYVSTFPNGASSPDTSGGSSIRMSDDSGKSFSDVYVVPDNDYIHSLRIAPSKADRIYAGGAVYQGGRAFYLARSDDAGQNWKRFPVQIADDETNFLLLAVSPVDSDLVLAIAPAAQPLVSDDRLLVSRDGGETFTSPFSTGALRDVAFSDDGTTLWLAGRDGLFRSDDDLQSFPRVGAGEEMSCVQVQPEGLYGCGWFKGLAMGIENDGIGFSTDEGASFNAWMSFQDIGPVTCGTDSLTTKTCASPWEDWQSEIQNTFNLPARADAGVADAGADSGAAGTMAGTHAPPDGAAQGGNDAAAADAAVETPGGGSGGCHVNAAPRRGASSGLAFGVLALGLAWLRRRGGRAGLQR